MKQNVIKKSSSPSIPTALSGHVREGALERIRPVEMGQMLYK